MPSEIVMTMTILELIACASEMVDKTLRVEHLDPEERARIDAIRTPVTVDN
jgi:hypothetical protein